MTTPALSVVLVGTHDYSLIRHAVRNLARQRDVALPMVALMVVVSSIGEAVGYVTREGGSSGAYLSDIEHDRHRFLRDGELSTPP